MANKRIIDLTEEAAVVNGDFVEIDNSGLVESRKATIEEITEIERTARIAQDDVIENSAGLNADGTFTPAAGSNYIKSADYATAGYSENLLNGQRLLDAQIASNLALINASFSTVTTVLSVSDINTLFTVPITLVDVSALAADILVDVIDCVAFLDYTAPVWNVGAQTLDVGYSGAADILTFTNAFVGNNADLYQKATPTDNAAMSVGTNVVVRLNSANPTAPPGGSSITIFLSYRLIDTV